MKRPIALSLVALGVALAVTRCDTVYDVTITLNDAAAGRAFGCSNDAGPLLGRLQGKPTTIVLDVIDLGKDVLSCRGTAILDHCKQPGSCKRIDRACYAVDFQSPATLNDVLAQAYAQLKAQDAGIAGIATDETVIIRLVATSEPGCPNGAFDTSQVGGCAFSCPTKLAASGTLDLDLDVPPGTDCELVVDVCSTFETL